MIQLFLHLDNSISWAQHRSTAHCNATLQRHYVSVTDSQFRASTSRILTHINPHNYMKFVLLSLNIQRQENQNLSKVTQYIN